jgi:HK97 gp10 family phage protein
MTITVDFDYIPYIIARVEAESRSIPKKVADRIVATAKRIVPVDTGALQDSIMAESVRTGKQADILVLAPYSAYVEYGTYKMAAQPFLGPAIEQHASEFYAEILGSVSLG